MPRSETSSAIMFFYVYLLESVKNGNHYIGYSQDLKQRIKEHNRGLNSSTRPYRPWRIIYYEACLTESDAKRRERYLKTTQGMRLLKRRLKDYFYNKQRTS